MFTFIMKLHGFASQSASQSTRQVADEPSTWIYLRGKSLHVKANVTDFLFWYRSCQSFSATHASRGVGSLNAYVHDTAKVKPKFCDCHKKIKNVGRALHRTETKGCMYSPLIFPCKHVHLISFAWNNYRVAYIVKTSIQDAGKVNSAMFTKGPTFVFKRSMNFSFLSFVNGQATWKSSISSRHVFRSRRVSRSALPATL